MTYDLSVQVTSAVAAQRASTFPVGRSGRTHNDLLGPASNRWLSCATLLPYRQPAECGTLCANRSMTTSAIA